MSDKLEALSQPVAEFRKCYPLGIDSPPGGFFQPLPGIKNVKPGEQLYSHEYVTALIQRSEAAKQREDHLKADVALMAQRNKELAEHNAELEQRLQQPIKLRSRVFEMMNVGGGHSIQVVSVKAVKEIIRAAGFKVEGE